MAKKESDFLLLLQAKDGLGQEHTTARLESDIVPLLKRALAKKNITDFSVRFRGNTENGSGYISDVIFAAIKTSDNRTYYLAIKCSKSSVTLLENNPAFGLAFSREIYMYEEVLPYFITFQTTKSAEVCFKSVPNFLGSFSGSFTQLVVLEDLRKQTFQLWNGCNPFPRSHINQVMIEYAKLHATSVAIQEQEPEKFQSFLKNMERDVMTEFFQSSDFVSMNQTVVLEIAQMLEGETSPDILQKWSSLRAQMPHINLHFSMEPDDLKVILHGDCWNNNFMFKYTNAEQTTIAALVILDWQISGYSTPIKDLSYFLFSCISPEDLNDVDEILNLYHKTFCEHLVRLGSNFGPLYTLDRLKNDWKKYGKFGISQCLTTVKLPYCQGKNAPNMTAAAEKGEDLSEAFKIQVDDARYKKRMKAIVEYSVKAELV